VLSLCPLKINSNTMTQFHQINDKDLEYIIQHLKSSSCCLDIIPTGFFKNVFHCMATDLLHIVNKSLHSGIFPQALKTAVIIPLLKKNNLDASVMNNYRPISNLPFQRSVPRVRTKHGEAAFSYYAPKIWNKLPETCRSAATLTTFKSRLKTFLLPLLLIELFTS